MVTKNLNIKEIAMQMGISPTSVSLVLNGKKGVSDAVRRKVKAVLIENGYNVKEDQIQDAFLPGRRLLLVYYRGTDWLSSRKDNFFPRVIDGIESGCKKYNCEFSITYARYEELTSVLPKAKQRGYDGIMFLGTEYCYDDYSFFMNLDCPAICLDRPFDYYPVNSVYIDNGTGLYQAVHCLKSFGHKRIGYLCSESPSGGLENRRKCFFDVMRKLDMEINDDWSVELNFLMDESKNRLEKYIQTQKDIPTAFIAENDVIASSALHTLQKHGFSIPDDISIIGFDDSCVSMFVSPHLTTIRAEVEKMAELAVKYLCEMISNGESQIIKTGVRSYLIQRSSTGKAKNKE